MDEVGAVPVTAVEWHQGLAEMYRDPTREVLLAMLGYLTSELSDELRGDCLAFGRRFVADQAELRAKYRPLTLATPLD